MKHIFEGMNTNNTPPTGGGVYMRITWVTRSFLDYRIPIYEEINRICGEQLTVIYFKDIVPERCQGKLRSILGDRAIGLTGEIRFGGKKIENQTFANSEGIRIPLRPGLVNRIRSTKPDIILSDGFFQWTYAALLVNIFWTTPHIMCYERTMYTERNVSRLRTFSRRLAARYINAICCNGNQTKEYLINFGFPEDKLYLGNMAADSKGLQESVNKITQTQIAEFKKKQEIKGLIFLFVGQLIPRKGIMEMLDAWKEFTIQYTEPTLVLLGGGDQKDQATKHINERSIEHVRLLGKVDYSEVPLFYASADIFLISTLEDNWSLVVPEAMSCGLPVLCSKYNGCWPELVKPENGWVFDPLNSEEFVQTLKTAWENRKKWQQMGQESLKIVSDYTPEKVAGNIYNACQSMIQKKIR